MNFKLSALLLVEFCQRFPAIGDRATLLKWETDR